MIGKDFNKEDVNVRLDFIKTILNDNDYHLKILTDDVISLFVDRSENDIRFICNGKAFIAKSVSIDENDDTTFSMIGQFRMKDMIPTKLISFKIKNHKNDDVILSQEIFKCDNCIYEEPAYAALRCRVERSFKCPSCGYTLSLKK